MAISRISFTSDGLTLEGLLALPQGEGPFPGVVVCHPHPLHGGDMHNAVVERIGHALEQRGMAALRFNFRGTGQSQGRYDQGVGEAADALAAVDFLGKQGAVDRLRMGIAGYSFGAGVALDATAENHDLRAVALVACPTAPLNDLVFHGIPFPKLFVQGDMDYLIPLDQFRFLVQRFRPPREVEVLEGADHSLVGHESRVGALVSDFFARTFLRE
ncbi:MAG: prolyl oligopeptidase family serine peptidase [Chloroflexi bacterium]|nr:prolyl oligopeptidase family serine peptidase [Chloroflexota bacterium]